MELGFTRSRVWRSDVPLNTKFRKRKRDISGLKVVSKNQCNNLQTHNFNQFYLRIHDGTLFKFLPSFSDNLLEYDFYGFILF